MISLYLTIDENDWGSKCMVQKVSGWVTFKFSLPKQGSEKTNHKELELSFHNRSQQYYLTTNLTAIVTTNNILPCYWRDSVGTNIHIPACPIVASKVILLIRPWYPCILRLMRTIEVQNCMVQSGWVASKDSTLDANTNIVSPHFICWLSTKKHTNRSSSQHPDNPQSSFSGWPWWPPSSALPLFYLHIIVALNLALCPTASAKTTRMWDRLQSASQLGCMSKW
jgi:hypothetical protein